MDTDAARSARSDRNRAQEVRRRIATGTASDVDRAWLSRWESASLARRTRGAPPPTLAPEVILRAVATDFGVEIAAIRRPMRNSRSVELARRVAVLAMHMAGCTPTHVAAALGRSRVVASIMVSRAKKAPPMIADRARAVIVAAGAVTANAVAGDVVMVPIVVGSAAWRYLDRLAELDEITQTAIQHHGQISDQQMRAE